MVGSDIPHSSSVSPADLERINSNFYPRVCCQRRSEAAGPDKSSQPYFDSVPAEAWGCSAGRAVGPRGPAPSAGERAAGAAGLGQGLRTAGPHQARPRRRRAPVRLTSRSANRKPGFLIGSAYRSSNCPISTQEVNGSSCANVGSQMSQSSQGRFLTNEIKEVAE